MHRRTSAVVQQSVDHYVADEVDALCNSLFR